MSTKVDQLVKDIGNLTALELAQLTKSLEGAFGVSAAMPAGAGVAAAAAPAAEAGAKKEEEKNEYKVELVSVGANKINVIKALRQVKKDLGLTQAREIVESAPSVLAEAASKDEAKAFKEALEAAGAQVKLS
jgi:large subunit ribosomal protein L7/L12